MEDIQKEIQEEMRRSRLDKTRLYDLLLKIVDRGVAGPPGPVGPMGPPGRCECKKCVGNIDASYPVNTTEAPKKVATEAPKKVATEAPKEVATTTTKKTTATKKKTTTKKADTPVASQ